MAQLITVFGGTGFIGRYVVQALAASGRRIRVAVRDPRSAWFLQPLTALGQAQAVSADFSRPDSIARAVHGADAVINLVGILKGDFQAVHVAGARAVAEAATRAGVRALVHMSAIGADPASESAYGRTKGEGEAAVRAVLPGAALLRPSVVFGPEDQLTNRFGEMIARLPCVPVVRGQSRFQPVYVADVARATVAALSAPGGVYELGGPEVMSMRALLARLCDLTGRPQHFVDVPDPVAAALATLFGWVPGAPITRDQWVMLQKDAIVSGQHPGLGDLGVSPTPMDAVASEWLVRFRHHGRFGAQVVRTHREQPGH